MGRDGIEAAREAKTTQESSGNQQASWKDGSIQPQRAQTGPRNAESRKHCIWSRTLAHDFTDTANYAANSLLSPLVPPALRPLYFREAALERSHPVREGIDSALDSIHAAREVLHLLLLLRR